MKRKAIEILKNMVEDTVMFLTNDLPSLLEQEHIAKIRRIHKDEILKNLPKTQTALRDDLLELVGEDEPVTGGYAVQRNNVRAEIRKAIREYCGEGEE